MHKQRYRVAFDYASGRVYAAQVARTGNTKYLVLRYDSRPDGAALLSYNVARAVAQRNGGIIAAA